MNFLELPSSELDPQFGPRFLYQAYLRLIKSHSTDDKLVLILKKDFDELRNQVTILTKSLGTARAEFTTTLDSVHAEYSKMLDEVRDAYATPTEASKSVPGPVSPTVEASIPYKEVPVPVLPTLGQKLSSIVEEIQNDLSKTGKLGS